MTLALQLRAGHSNLANRSSHASLFARSFRSCASAQLATSLFSIVCALFEKITGDRGGVGAETEISTAGGKSMKTHARENTDNNIVSDQIGKNLPPRPY